MYGQFFNIDESVFSIAPNPKYLYLSKQHEEALAHLVYGVTRKGGFVCLTGDIGTGKTTVCRCMFEQLPENTDIAFVINPKFSPMELLASICDELHIGYSTFQPSIKEYVKKLYTYLIEAHAKGRSTVLVIDEAQNLSVEALEHIRSLTNIETNEQKLLQIILIGQPELKSLLARPELEQVNQRITARFHIGPLSLNETNRYIHHRLLVAGAKQKIFSSANIKQIYKLAKGVPRRINILCDRVLLGACTLGESNISSKVIRQSAEEVFDNVSANKDILPKALAASIFALLISGVTLFAYQGINTEPRNLFSLLSTETKKDVAMTSIVEKASIQKASIQQASIQSDKLETKEIASEVANRVTSEKEIVSENIVEDEVVQIAVLDEQQLDEKPASFIADTKEGQTSNPETPEVQEQNVSSVKDTSVSGALPAKKALEFTSYGKAYQRLFRLWGVGYFSTDVAPCEYAISNHLHCYHARGDLKKIIGLNRPVLLKSKTEQFGSSYIVVVSIEGDHAIVNQSGDYQLVAITEIEANWSGEFEMLWRPLRAGVSHIKPGQQGEEIAFLDQKLAELQGRESTVAHPFVYSGELVDQVRAFQIANNLPADGVVGPITQMQFNNKNLDTPYLTK